MGLESDRQEGLSDPPRGLDAVAPRWLKGLCAPDSHPRKRAIETNVYRTATGVVLSFARRVSGWVLTAGEGRGWGFLSPYVVDEITPNGIALSHSGVIEAVCPEGDSHFIPFKG